MRHWTAPEKRLCAIIAAGALAFAAGCAFLPERETLPPGDGAIESPANEGEKIPEKVLKVFFNNRLYDPQAMTMEVFPLERRVPAGADPARAALEALLAGPTEEERAAGYDTSIPAGTELLSVKVENGTARADFDYRLDFQVGGSTRVSYIGRQIIRTLKQFPEIEQVVISIEGRTGDILQP